MKAAAFTVKVAEVELAGTVTGVGTVSAEGALLETVTALLLAADLERVTVQVVPALGARLAVAHCKEETVGRVARARLAVADVPPSVPVMVTF